MKTIQLNTGEHVILDNGDFEALSVFKWFSKNGYAARHLPRNGGPTRMEYLHRIITNAPRGMEVDHINGNKLDNRLSNLRLALPGENQKNAKKHRNGSTSKYKGVSWSKKENRFIAQICVNGKQTRVGSFQMELDAAKAYDSAAIKYHGEFARPNQA